MKQTSTLSAKDLKAMPLIDQPEMRQFVVHISQHRARVEYDRQGDRIFLTRTDVPKALQSQLQATALVHRVLDHVEQERMKLVPLCPEVKSFLRKHPEWQRLLVKGINL